MDLRLKGTCDTCRHWQMFPQNTMAGRCPVLGALLWPKTDGDAPLLVEATDEKDAQLQAEISITSDEMHDPVSEVIAVRTTGKFGCVHHHPKVC